jgi:hypothetical protein
MYEKILFTDYKFVFKLLCQTQLKNIDLSECLITNCDRSTDQVINSLDKLFSNSNYKLFEYNHGDKLLLPRNLYDSRLMIYSCEYCAHLGR